MEVFWVFWKSILGGIAILDHWQVWLSILIYVFASFVFLLLLILLTKKKGKLVDYLLIIGEPVFHGVLMGLMISYLLPILLGGSSGTPISIIFTSFWQMIIAGIIAIFIVIVLFFIPIIRDFIVKSPGIKAFLEGVIIFRILSGGVIDQILSEANIQANVYPGFWASIGYLIISAILIPIIICVVSLISGFIVAKFGSSSENSVVDEILPGIFAPVIGILGGILPLFMYCSYVNLSIQQLFG